MAGSANPGFNPNMQSYPIPDSDVNEVQPVPMIDWASPPPSDSPTLVDSLIGDDPMSPGQPFIRRVSMTGQTDLPDRVA